VLKLPDYCHGINVTDSGRIDHITYRVICNQGQKYAKMEWFPGHPKGGVAHRKGEPEPPEPARMGDTPNGTEPPSKYRPRQSSSPTRKGRARKLNRVIVENGERVRGR
jgi:hypothetical protein